MKNLSLTHIFSKHQGYIRRITRSHRSDIEKEYIKEHNAFYGWVIGDKKEKDIEKLASGFLVSLKKNEDVPPSTIALSCFLKSFETELNVICENENISISNISENEIKQENWFKIREKYEKSIKENNNTFLSNTVFKGPSDGNNDGKVDPFDFELDNCDVPLTIEKYQNYLEELIQETITDGDEAIDVMVKCIDKPKLNFKVAVILHDSKLINKMQNSLKQVLEGKYKTVKCNAESTVIAGKKFYYIVGEFIVDIQRKGEYLFVDADDLLLSQ
jgi:hypothetical protein